MPVTISNSTKPQTFGSAVVRIFVLTALLLLHLAALGCGDPRNGAESSFDDESRGAVGAGGGAGASGDGSVLLKPDPEARERAERIRVAIPGARLHFSQRTGHLMMVQGPRAVDAENPSPPKPLAATRGVTEESLAATLIDYFVRFEDVYSIEAPAETLRLPKDSNVGPVPETVVPSLTHLQKPAEQISVHLTHTHQGLPVQGRYATGLFDREGNLRAVLTRLLELPEDLDPAPSLTGDEAIELIFAELPSMVEKDTSLIWLQDVLEVPESVKLLFWYPKDRRGGSLALAYEIEMRGAVESARFVVDAHSGGILEAGSSIRSDWHDEGQFQTTPAPDEHGYLVQIPSSVFEGSRYMGYGANQFGARFFRAGEALVISDVTDLLLYWGRPTPPIEISTADANDWLSDLAYNTEHQFAATRLMENLTNVMQWWSDRGWRSYDGRGSSVTALVGYRPSRHEGPYVRTHAPRGRGLVVGDGRSPTGWYTSASAEIVGHEFMHLVVGATSHFAYHEAGAVEEALADIFGVAMTARDDRLSGSWFGDDIDLAMRDLGDPTRSGQPDRYSRYRELPFSDDMGGVHTNSGILNKAHYLVTTGGRFNGIRVRTQGVAATTNVLREANQLLAWDPYTSMEEFALGVLGYCDLIAAIGGAIGNQGLDATCDAFSHAYLAVELLPGSSDLDLAIDSVQIGIDGNLDVVISNRSYLPEVPSEHFDLVIFDSLGSAITPALPATFQESVAPGESITVRTGVAAGFMGPFTRSSTAAISVELLPLPGYSNNDVDMSNNSASMEVGPDLVPVRLAWSEGPDLVEVSGRVTNIGRTGYAENTGAVVLVRDTASGELSVFDGVDVTLATDGGSPSRADDTGLRGIAFPEVQTVFVHGGREMPRNLISGTSRFAGTSSLYPLLQTWFDADGGRVELEGRFQVYLFVDAYDLVEETDETNNLLCVNCRGSSDIYDLPVVVRLPNEVDTDAIFPEPFRAAAAKLKSFRPFSRYPERFERERFSPHTPGPIVELP